MVVAAKLYENGKLSAKDAAESAGLTKQIFFEAVCKYGVSIFSNSFSDVYCDIENA